MVKKSPKKWRIFLVTPLTGSPSQSLEIVKKEIKIYCFVLKIFNFFKNMPFWSCISPNYTWCETDWPPQKRRNFRYTISWHLAMEILGFKVADVCECFLYFCEGKQLYILTAHWARLHARVDFNCIIYRGTYWGSINAHWHIWRPQTEYQFLLNGPIIAGWFLWKIGHHEKFKVRILKRVDWLSWWKNNDWPSDSEIRWDGIRYEQRCVSSKQSLSINIDITGALFKFEYTDAEFPM